MFYIVVFESENVVEAVPEQWMKTVSSCHWPPVSSNPSKLIRSNSPVNTLWPVYQVRILGSCETYSEAVLKVNRAKDGSDLNTDEDFSHIVSKSRSGRRLIAKRLTSDSEDCEEECDAPKEREKTDRKRQKLSLPVPPSSLLQPLLKPSTPAVSKEKKRDSGTSRAVQISTFDKECDEENLASSLSEETNLEKSQLTHPMVSSSRPLSRPCNVLQERNAVLGRPVDLLKRTSDKVSELEFQKRILHLLEEIKLEQKNQRNGLRMLQVQLANGHSSISTSGIPEPFDFPVKFPMSTLVDLELTEDFLKNSSDMKHFVDHLSTIGGSSSDDATRRILSHLMTNRLGMALSYAGKKGKKAFSNLLLKLAIQKALQKTYGTQMTEHMFKKAVGNWLRFARGRLRGTADKENLTQQ